MVQTCSKAGRLQPGRESETAGPRRDWAAEQAQDGCVGRCAIALRQKHGANAPMCAHVCASGSLGADHDDGGGSRLGGGTAASAPAQQPAHPGRR